MCQCHELHFTRLFAWPHHELVQSVGGGSLAIVAVFDFKCTVVFGVLRLTPRRNSEALGVLETDNHADDLQQWDPVRSHRALFQQAEVRFRSMNDLREKTGI